MKHSKIYRRFNLWELQINIDEHEVVSVDSTFLVPLSFVVFYLVYVLSFNFQRPQIQTFIGTRLGFN